MKLEKDAKIFTTDGKEIGTLSRFVIDPRTKNITNIVFKHGLLSQNEYIIPMRLVDHVDAAGIHLSELPIKHLEELPLFLQEEFVVADENALLDETYSRGNFTDSYYYYPSIPLASGSAMYPHGLFINDPGAVGPANEQIGATVTGVPNTGSSEEPAIIRRTEENIPEGTVSLKEGSKVYSSDGKQIGRIERVFVDTDSGRTTHLVVSKGLLLKERKQIPADWIDQITADEIHLAVNAAYTSRLPDYQEK